MTDTTERYARAVVAELRSAQGDGTDWTEDLFRRAADLIETLVERENGYEKREPVDRADWEEKA